MRISINKKGILFILLLLIMINTSYSICGESRTADLLAIVGEKGDLIKTKIDSFEGSSILINMTIPYGVSTQRSIIAAHRFIMNYLDEDCSFIITIPSKYELNGPSGGSLFALKFYEIITDEKPIKSYVTTGGISEDGFIIPVGGVYEKIDAFLKGKEKVMFFPKTKAELDIISLEKIKKEGKEGYVINDIREIINYLYKGKEINYSYEEQLLSDVEIKTKYNSSLVKEWASSYIKEENRILKKLKGEYKNYLKEAIKRQEKLVKKDYFYTVANDAFDKLSYAKAYLNIKDNKSDIGYLEKCLDSVEFYDERETNYELIAGAKSRYYRALSTYKNVIKENSSLFLERVSKEADVEKAILWCELAKSLNKEGEGKAVDNEYLKSIIESIEFENDLNERMKMMLENEDYLAFLYEYSFVREGRDNLKERYGSIWANIYASQAEYFKNKGEKYSDLAKIANNMEDLFKKVKFKEKSRDNIKNERKDSIYKENYLNILYVIISFLGGVLICMLLKLLKK